MTVPPLVTVSDLHLSLPAGTATVDILRGIDLTIAPGERVSLVGPSGSGKTTLLMLIAGLERPTRGKISVAGAHLHELDEDGLARVRRDRIGIVFQGFHLIPTMTALENVAVPLELVGDRRALDHARAGLAAVGLAHRLSHYPSQLSGGEQQRVALARAMVRRPALVLADEPTGNLDTATGLLVMDLLFQLAADRGSSLLLITHDARLAGRCDRCVRIADGRLTGADSPEARRP